MSVFFIYFFKKSFYISCCSAQLNISPKNNQMFPECANLDPDTWCYIFWCLRLNEPSVSVCLECVTVWWMGRHFLYNMNKWITPQFLLLRLLFSLRVLNIILWFSRRSAKHLKREQVSRLSNLWMSRAALFHLNPASLLWNAMEPQNTNPKITHEIYRCWMCTSHVFYM